MLSLVNKYGLSHVCADPEFKNIEYFGDGKDGNRDIFNFPYLDMHFNETSSGIFLRGTKDKEWEFKNLFEYLFWTSLHGPGSSY